MTGGRVGTTVATDTLNRRPSDWSMSVWVMA